jgi:hypothetical protein
MRMSLAKSRRATKIRQACTEMRWGEGDGSALTWVMVGTTVGKDGVKAEAVPVLVAAFFVLLPWADCAVKVFDGRLPLHHEELLP